MDTLKEILQKNEGKYPDFKYYFLHISKIESNLFLNPDIAIETCKSLIEGISKSILNRIDNTFNEKLETTGNRAKSVQQLFKRALEKIAEQNEKFEQGFVHSSGQIINITSEIRTERGDISHGKSAPKEISSTPQFAVMISKMTDIILGYVLEHFFQIDLSYKEKLAYDSESMTSFNNWLDESVDFPIAKAKYSHLLFEYDYDEYESRYNDEFLKSLDPDDYKKEEIEIVAPIQNPIVEKKQITIPKNRFHRKSKTKNTIGDLIPEEQLKQLKSKFETNENPIVKEEKIIEKSESKEHKGLGLAEWFEAEIKKPSKLSPEESKRLYDLHFGKFDKTKSEPVVLVNTFDEHKFWTEKRNAELVGFAHSYNLKQTELKEFINKYYFTGKEPRRDEVEKVMVRRPSLENRRTDLLVILELIIEFADRLKEQED
jgi:hypothetical protein